MDDMRKKNQRGNASTQIIMVIGFMILFGGLLQKAIMGVMGTVLNGIPAAMDKIESDK
jgi:hypothetical protein